MIKVALIDQTGSISPEALQLVAKALTIQVVRDFEPYYGKQATVTVQKELAAGYWPIYIKREIGRKGMNGYHYFTAENLPYSMVKFGTDWTITASHELLEMLHNPYAVEFEGYNEVEYVEEVSDATNGRHYEIDGVKVSNFITPNYWDLTKTEGIKYDFMGLLTEPRQLVEGGYMSFTDNLGNYYTAFKEKGKIFIRKILGDASPMTFAENPVTYIATALFLYIIFKIIRRK
jgi:hypothetical protein